jgi:IMP cyclohydrolase
MIELLKKMRYPGRFLALGMDGDAHVALYGATGRSPSSLARRYVQDGNAIYASAVDDTVKREGNPDLLEYPALVFFDNGLTIANGRQIEKITELQNREAKKQLSYALSEEAYEPDEYRTPRITGCLVKGSSGMDAAIHIARSASDGIDLSSWTVPLESGKGMYISTYIGEDVRPTPSFSGAPLPVVLNFGSAKKAAKAMYEALAPKRGEADYRIGYFAVYIQEGKSPEIAIQNKL